MRPPDFYGVVVRPLPGAYRFTMKNFEVNNMNYIYTPAHSCILFSLFALLLIAAAYSDIKTMRIPDIIPAVIAAISLLSLLLHKGPAYPSRLAGAIFCLILLGTVSLLTEGGIGVGDIKLMTASGLFLGLHASILSIFMSYITAGLWYLIPLIRGKVHGQTPAPMVPFFAPALIICGLWYREILDAYFSLTGMI